jgi:hypothetical protein
MLRAITTIVLLAALLPAASSAATWKGHSVDGPRFSATLVHDDFGAISNVEVKFSGCDVTVYAHASQLYLVLDDEEISDPRHIMARDNRRGITWEIDVRNLREATPRRSSGGGLPGYRLAPMMF